MKKNVALGFILFALVGCKQVDSSASHKDREQRIHANLFRTGHVNMDLREQLFQIGKGLWKHVADKDSVYIYTATIGSDLKVIQLCRSEKTAIEDLRDSTYQIWENKSFVCTALLYKSYSVDAVTQEETTFWVIEIEHEELTGRYFFFVYANTFDLEHVEIQYIERG